MQYSRLFNQFLIQEPRATPLVHHNWLLQKWHDFGRPAPWEELNQPNTLILMRNDWNHTWIHPVQYKLMLENFYQYNSHVQGYFTGCPPHCLSPFQPLPTHKTGGKLLRNDCDKWNIHEIAPMHGPYILAPSFVHVLQYLSRRRHYCGERKLFHWIQLKNVANIFRIPQTIHPAHLHTYPQTEKQLR